MTEENAIGALAALFIIGLVGLAIIRVLRGAEPNDTILVWLSNHPDLFAGIIIFLVLVGIIFNIASRK